MAYFNNAFQQTFVPTSFLVAGGEDSSVYTPMEAGFIGSQSYDTASTATLAAGKTPVMLCMGSPLGSPTGVAGAANDILGGNRFHGGYAESWKSKVINPRYVRFIGKQPVVAAATSSVVLDAKGTCFDCIGEQSVRIDLKGAPVLRALNRNGYKILGGDGYCCPAGQTYKDPAKVFADMAVQLLRDPILSQLVDVKVEHDNNAGSFTTITDSATAAGNTRYEKQQAAIALLLAYSGAAAVVAGHLGKFTITDTSSETVFGNCSFDTRDYYQEEPLQLYASQLDNDGDPCTATCIDISRNKGKESETKGELIQRDVMMFQRYMQHPTNQGNLDSTRMREVERVGPANDLLGIVRSANYTVYYLLHTVPRFNNPSGTFDNDQYMVKLATNGIIANLETALNAMAVGCFGVGSTMTDMSANFLPTEGFPVGNSQGV
jgi:hypothetical protein